MQKPMPVSIRMVTLVICFVGSGLLFAQKISPYLVGNNVWLPEELTDEIWQITSECPMQMLRIGGEGYDNKQFNQTTLDGWMDKIQNLCKAEPLLQVPQNSTTAEAAALVQRYTRNRTTQKVMFYNIGNEPGLHGDNAAKISAMIKNLAPAMRDVEPAIKIFVFDECDLNYGNLAAQMFDTPNGQYDITGKDSKGRWYVDGLAWHRYPGGAANNLAYDGYNDILQRITGAKAMMDRANKRQNRTGEAALGWGIGEYNAPNGPSVHTWACGQMIGGLLGQCMKYEATYACYWDMFERGGVRTNNTDFSFIDGVGGKRPRAQYWHMAFVSREFSGAYADGTCNVPDVLTYGCKDTNKLCAIIINRANANQSYTLRFDKNVITAGACRINLDAATAVQHQGDITGLATQCLVFNANGQLIRRYNYSSADFTKLTPPAIENFGFTALLDSKPKAAINAATCEIQITASGLNVVFPGLQEYTLKIVELNGRVIARQNGNSKSAFVNTQAITPGVYLLHVAGKSGSLKREFVIGNVSR
jgi:hypothetical protein